MSTHSTFDELRSAIDGGFVREAHEVASSLEEQLEAQQELLAAAERGLADAETIIESRTGKGSWVGSLILDKVRASIPASDPHWPNTANPTGESRVWEFTSSGSAQNPVTDSAPASRSATDWPYEIRPPREEQNQDDAPASEPKEA